MFVAHPSSSAYSTPPVWLVSTVATFLVGDPIEEILETKRHQFLAPGGPDDPFAGDPFDDD
jgi:hypothetical protein